MQRLLLARECGDEVHGLDDMLSARWASLVLDLLRQYKVRYCQMLNFIDIDRPAGSLVLCGGSTSLEYGDVNSASVGLFHYTEAGKKSREDHLVQYTHSRSSAAIIEFKCGQWFPYDSAIFVTGSSKHGEVIIWDTERFAPVTNFDLGSLESTVVSTEMSLAPGARTELIAVAREDSTDLVLVDMDTGASTHRLQAHPFALTGVTWAPINPYLVASVDCGGSAFLFDIRRSGKTACLVQFNQSRRIPNFDTARTVLRRSQQTRRSNEPQGNYVSGSTNILGLGCIWNTNSEHRLNRKRRRRETAVGLSFQGHALRRARFTPDGSTLMTSDSHGLLRVWDVITGRLIRTHNIGTNESMSWSGSFEISRDGLHILCSSRRGLVTLDAEEGYRVGESPTSSDMTDLTLHPLHEEALSVNTNTITCWSPFEEVQRRTELCPM